MIEEILFLFVLILILFTVSFFALLVIIERESGDNDRNNRNNRNNKRVRNKNEGVKKNL